jgi:hypothetical protein
MALIKVGDETFEIATEENRLATTYLHTVWDKAGKPNRIEGESAWKVVDAIFQIFAASFPYEYQDFRNTIKEDQSNERTVHDSNKMGGHFTISYPIRLLQLLKVYFPYEHYQDRDFTRKFLQRYPYLKVTKYAI